MEVPKEVQILGLEVSRIWGSGRIGVTPSALRCLGSDSRSGRVLGFRG